MFANPRLYSIYQILPQAWIDHFPFVRKAGPMKSPLLLFPLAYFLALGLSAAKQPNFLIILADDCTYNDLPLYGGQNAKTPNIDKLASQGLTFNRAFLAEAMCQPCRSELYTGQYPLRNGCAWNHSGSLSTVTSMPHHLSERGYRVGLAGKVHVKPAAAYPFEKVAGFDLSCVRNPTNPHELDGIRRFMSRDPEQPFCLVVALVEPHVPWVMGDASRYPPKKLKLPPNLADTPKTREDFSKYLAEITYMDGQVGEILGTLGQTGHAEDTLVLFSSEQGSQFPGCKWTNWNTGVHTALVARWPGKVPVGKRTDALVQYADVLPTLLEISDAAVPLRNSKLDWRPDGSSFLPVLTSESKKHRNYVYAIHNNLPEGPPFPVRGISDGEYRYLRNLLPDELYIEKHLMGLKGNAVLNNPYWSTWVRDSWENPHTYKLVKRYMRRPAEQLYHTAEDPYEMNNLAKDPLHAKRLAELRAELDRWMKEQGDPGAPMDTFESYRAARAGKHLHKPE